MNAQKYAIYERNPENMLKLLSCCLQEEIYKLQQEGYI